MVGKRKGAIALTMLIFLTAAMGVVAITIDYGRLQFIRTQLRTAADAAALAGELQLYATRDTAAAKASAHAMGLQNTVNRVPVDIQLSDIRVGEWTDVGGSRGLDTAGGPSTVYNAVKVTARATGDFLLAGRVFGTQNGELRVTAVAWGGGSVAETPCVRPWAVPYSALLGTLGHDMNDVGYNLTQQDVNLIRESSAANGISIDLGSGQTQINAGPYQGQYAPGNFGHLDFHDGMGYRDAIGTCSTAVVGVNAAVDSRTGASVGQTSQGVADLCQSNGTYVSQQGGFRCNYPVKVVIWDQVTGTGTGTSYHVKYVGGFVVTEYRHPGALYGYFTGFQTTGPVVPSAGPIQRVILVK